MTATSARVLVLLVVLVVFAPACRADRPAAAPPSGARAVAVAGPAGRLDVVELGEGERVVVLSHGATGTKEGFYPLIPALAGAGFRAIAYDARGVGGSEGKPDVTTRAEDLAAVVTYARDSGATSVSLGGASLGAAVTLSAASGLDADAVIALSPAVADPSVLPEELSELQIFIAVAEDNEPFATQARALGEVLGVDPVVVSGSSHGTGMFTDHPELVDAIVSFLAGTR
jgi:alpha-beta hydrolase superfamily lysophospholipase